jgi:hypothetical protein
VLPAADRAVSVAAQSSPAYMHSTTCMVKSTSETNSTCALHKQAATAQILYVMITCKRQ